MTAKITWTNETRKLSELKPWTRNPRQIDKASAERLADSFEAFGQVETIAIGPDNELYNGHQRLNVLQDKHGKDFEVEVRVSSRALTEKEREKLTVYLHKGATGEFDFDALANEFELDDLLEWGFEEHDLLGLEFDMSSLVGGFSSELKEMTQYSTVSLTAKKEVAEKIKASISDLGMDEVVSILIKGLDHA